MYCFAVTPVLPPVLGETGHLFGTKTVRFVLLSCISVYRQNHLMSKGTKHVFASLEQTRRLGNGILTPVCTLYLIVSCFVAVICCCGTSDEVIRVQLVSLQGAVSILRLGLLTEPRHAVNGRTRYSRLPRSTFTCWDVYYDKEI